MFFTTNNNRISVQTDSKISMFWFKQYFTCSFTCKQLHTTSIVSGSDGKLEAYTGHFLEFQCFMNIMHIFQKKIKNNNNNNNN